MSVQVKAAILLILAIVACCVVVADFSVSNNLASFPYLGLNVVSLRSKRFRGAKSEETGLSAFCPRKNWG